MTGRVCVILLNPIYVYSGQTARDDNYHNIYLHRGQGVRDDIIDVIMHTASREMTLLLFLNSILDGIRCLVD